MNFIRHHYFNDNEEQFNRYFVLPAVVTMYNVGATTFSHVLLWFTLQYAPLQGQNSRKFQELKAEFSGQEGHGLFDHMCRAAKASYWRTRNRRSDERDRAASSDNKDERLYSEAIPYREEFRKGMEQFGPDATAYLAHVYAWREFTDEMN